LTASPEAASYGRSAFQNERRKRGGELTTKLKQGSVTLTSTETIAFPEKAGKMTVEEVGRLEKPRRGLGVTCEKSADALRKNTDRITVPGVDPAALEAAGEAAENIDGVIADVEHLLMFLKQANALLDSHAHRELRKVLAAVRSQEKFDPKLADLFPHLIAYFASTRSGGSAAPPGGAPPDGKPE